VASGGGIRWEGDLNEARLQLIGPKIKRAMVVASAKTAAEGEAWMKSSAKWRDQTGNARNGLGGQSVVTTNKVATVFYHTVPYGIWLEVRWDGKYAVIGPAVERFAPRMMGLVAKLAFTQGGS
jgi:hypothetical protein